MLSARRMASCTASCSRIELDAAWRACSVCGSAPIAAISRPSNSPGETAQPAERQLGGVHRGEVLLPHQPCR